MDNGKNYDRWKEDMIDRQTDRWQIIEKVKTDGQVDG